MVSDRTLRRRRSVQLKGSGLSPRPTGSDFVERGAPGYYPFAGFQYREVANVPKVSYDELQLMIDLDGHARALFNVLRRPILRNTKRAYIAPSGINEGQKEAEFIDSNLLLPRHMGGMTIPLTKVFGHMCMAFIFGFKPFLKVYDRPGSVVDDDYIRLRKLAPRDPRTISFLVDNTGGFDGFRQRVHWQGRYIDETFSRNETVYYAVDEEEKPLYGKSLFLPAYNHFDKKHKMYYVIHLALAVGALSPRLATAKGNVSNEDKEAFLKALGNLGTNAAMLVPNGFEILDTQLEGAKTGLPYIEILQEHNMEMSKSILAQAIDIGTNGGTGGGFSLSKNNFDFLVMALEGIQEDMADMFNNFIIPDLINWNFKTKNYPRLVLPPFSSEIRDLLSDTFRAVTSAREIPWSPEFMTELEKKMAGELNIEVPQQALDDNQAMRVAERELKQAMEEANLAIGKDASKVSASNLLKDPRFIKFAERLSERVRNSYVKEALPYAGDEE